MMTRCSYLLAVFSLPNPQLVERTLESYKQSAVVRSPLDKERVGRERGTCLLYNPFHATASQSDRSNFAWRY